MNARELIRNPALTFNQTARLLGVTPRTLQRWEQNDRIPQAAALVLRSIWSGLPVLADQIWPGWRFAVDGSLQTPGDYPLWPRDLWALEFLYRNGLFPAAARGDWKAFEIVAHELEPKAEPPAWSATGS